MKPSAYIIIHRLDLSKQASLVSVTNAPKDQHLESGGEELPEVSWRHQQQPSYAPSISSAADPYSAAGLCIVFGKP